MGIRHVSIFATLVLVAAGLGAKPGHADVRYLTDSPGFIEITGNDYTLWSSGKLPPERMCLPTGEGDCHCADARGSGDQPGRVVFLARRAACPGPASLASGTYNIEAIGHRGTFQLTIAGGALTGTTRWKCCPGDRVDPSNGRVNGTMIEFTRPCQSQGYTDPCVQVYTGTITGPNQASGRFTMNGADFGTWRIWPWP